MSEETRAPKAGDSVQPTGETLALGQDCVEGALVDLVGRRFGNILIKRWMTRGGMGEVYEGFDETLERRVAVKTLRAQGRLRPASHSRFLREARMLSALDHENICRIYDYIRGDESDLLVLELIEGETLTRAIAQGLARGSRLRIARQIVDALSAAHRRGVIHRDLKPGNVMITAEGRAKVLDFGLARSADEETEDVASLAGESHDAREETMTLGLGEPETRRGVVIGTPDYMSPEQARGEPLGPASDMYSLGLLLQTLWSGQSPYDEDTSRQELIALAQKGKSRPPIGIPRDIAALVKRLKQLDPSARPTATQVQERLQRVATKPQRLARLAAAVALVVVSVLGVTKYVVDLAHERDVAEAARRDLEVVTDFQSRMLSGLDLYGVGERLRADLRQRIEEGRQTGRAGEGQAAQPVLSAFDKAMARVNTSDAALRIFDEEVLERAWRAAEDEFRSRPAILGELLNSVGAVYNDLGLYDKGEAVLRSSLAMLEEARGAPAHLRFEAQRNLGMLVGEAGRYDEAVTLLQQAALGLDRVRGNEHVSTLIAKRELARVYSFRGEHEAAVELFRETLAACEGALGPEARETLATKSYLAWSLDRAELFEEAERIHLEVLETRSRVLGEEDLETLQSLNELAVHYVLSGQLDKAEPLYRRDLELGRKLLGDKHHQTLVSITNLGRFFNRLERYEEALPLLAEAVESSKEVLPEGHFGTGVSLQSYGEALLGLGRSLEARPQLREAFSILEPQLGLDHPRMKDLIEELADIAEAAGDAEDAVAWREKLSNGAEN